MAKHVRYSVYMDPDHCAWCCHRCGALWNDGEPKPCDCPGIESVMASSTRVVKEVIEEEDNDGNDQR